MNEPPEPIVIAWVVAPFDHVLPDAALDVNVTEPPSQNVVGPVADIVGALGMVLTVTVVAAEGADVHPFTVCVTVKLPAVETVIDCVVAPFDHKLPVAALEVRVTLPPVQKVVGPLAEIVGAAGSGRISTYWEAEAGEVHPFAVVVAE